jgi:hypothetical protein
LLPVVACPILPGSVIPLKGFADSFVAQNGLNLAGAYLVSPAFRLDSPKAINPAEIVTIEAFNQKVCESCSRLARQSHRLLDWFVHGNSNGLKILQLAEGLE